MNMDLAAEVEIRIAKQGDLGEVVELLADDPLGASRERPGPPVAGEYQAAFSDMLAQQGNDLLVVTHKSRVIGCVQLTMISGLSRLGAKRAQIESVRVASSYRGCGLGELMIRECIERARADGASLVQLTTDLARDDARRFYERLGFVASHWGMKLNLEI